MSAVPMLKVVLGSLFGKSATIKYPYRTKEPFEAYRGFISIDIDQCIFCGLCQRKCPTGAIAVTRAEKTWTIARYDCIQCGACTEVCPKKCLNMNNGIPLAYTVQERHVEIQKTPEAETKDA